MKYFVQLGQKYETSYQLVYEIIGVSITMLGDRTHVMIEFKNENQEAEVLDFNEFYCFLCDNNAKLVTD